MNAIADVLAELHHGEQQLADELLAVSDRHHSEHEIYHVARDLQRWSADHVQRLADIAPHYGPTLRDQPSEPARLLGAIRDKTADLVRRRPQPGLLVLHDLSTLYLVASDNSLHWEMLAQTAQGRRDNALLELATSCHPQTLRQIRWFNTMIKTMSPQILASPTNL